MKEYKTVFRDKPNFWQWRLWDRLSLGLQLKVAGGMMNPIENSENVAAYWTQVFMAANRAGRLNANN